MDYGFLPNIVPGLGAVAGGAAQGISSGVNLTQISNLMRIQQQEEARKQTEFGEDNSALPGGITSGLNKDYPGFDTTGMSQRRARLLGFRPTSGVALMQAQNHARSTLASLFHEERLAAKDPVDLARMRVKDIQTLIGQKEKDIAEGNTMDDDAAHAELDEYRHKLSEAQGDLDFAQGNYSDVVGPMGAKVGKSTGLLPGDTKTTVPPSPRIQKLRGAAGAPTPTPDGQPTPAPTATPGSDTYFEKMRKKYFGGT